MTQRHNFHRPSQIIASFVPIQFWLISRWTTIVSYSKEPFVEYRYQTMAWNASRLAHQIAKYAYGISCTWIIDGNRELVYKLTYYVVVVVVVIFNLPKCRSMCDCQESDTGLCGCFINGALNINRYSTGTFV